MLKDEYLKKVKQEENPILLTWYDELNNEFVAYVTRDKYLKKGRMLNQQINWDVFECNLTLEEVNNLRDEISPEQLSDDQLNVIRAFITNKDVDKWVL